MVDRYRAEKGTLAPDGAFVRLEDYELAEQALTAARARIVELEGRESGLEQRLADTEALGRQRIADVGTAAKQREQELTQAHAELVAQLEAQVEQGKETKAQLVLVERDLADVQDQLEQAELLARTRGTMLASIRDHVLKVAPLPPRLSNETLEELAREHVASMVKALGGT